MNKYNVKRSNLRDQHIYNAMKGYLVTIILILGFGLMISKFSPKHEIEMKAPLNEWLIEQKSTVTLDFEQISSALNSLMNSFVEETVTKTSDINNATDINVVEEVAELDSSVVNEIEKKVEKTFDRTSDLIKTSSVNVASSGLEGLGKDLKTGSPFGRPGNGLSEIGNNGVIKKEDPLADIPKFQVVEIEPKVNMRDLYKLIEYPTTAKKLNIQGKVHVNVLIGKDGKAIRYELEASDNPLLNRAAIEAVMAIEYEPAVQNGEKINCWVTIPIHFKLSK